MISPVMFGVGKDHQAHHELQSFSADHATEDDTL